MVKPKNKKTCRVCEDRFQPTVGFQKYCSADCRHQSELEARTCKQCGESFQRPRSTQIRFCSKKCANQHSAKRRFGKQGQFGNGKPKYPHSAVCPWCKQKYTKEAYKHRHCSDECAKTHGAFKRKRTLGAADPPWGCKGKGEDACRNCGYPATHLHHIVPRSKTRLGHRDMRNGLPLCRSCHYGWHHNTVVIYSDRLADEERAFAVELTSEWWVTNRYPPRPYTPDELESISYDDQAQIVEDAGGIAVVAYRYLTKEER